MAIKKVKLTEADLNRIVNKVIEEQTMAQDALNYVGGALKSGANAVGGAIKSGANAINNAARGVSGNDRISNLAAMMKSIQTKQVPQQVIVNPSSKLNGMPWKDYITKFKITPQEILAAQKLNRTGGGVAQAARTVAPKPVSPTKPAQPQAQMTPQQLQAIQGQAKRV
tara:strand:- start:45 stop:548 length:504 start_codon:yes stop_codon:yes gene_type:complete